MRLDFEYLESPLYGGPDQQRENDRTEACWAADKPPNDNNHDLDNRACHADADARRAFETQHQTVARPCAGVHANIDRAGIAHQENGDEQHCGLQNQVVFHRWDEFEGKIQPGADADDVRQRPPSDLLAHEQRTRKHHKPGCYSHRAGGDVQHFRESDFQHSPRTSPQMALDK